MSRNALAGVAPRSRAASSVDVLDGAQGAVDRQHRERQQEVGERDDDRAWAVDEGAERLVDQAEADQRLVEDAVAAQNALPGVDLHQIAAEQRDQRDEQQRGPKRPARNRMR